ncbi:MAG: hypothetical protein RB294_06720 [Bacteroidales bacterium]|jgi:hypothetical protein|nr:hypothetical protein [Bacteroidales bacterium]
MKTIKSFIMLASLVLLMIPIQMSAQEDASDAKPCVVLSMWDCSEYCTGSQCYQFTNNCTYKVKVTWKSKQPSGKWISGDVYLDPDETSTETYWCPYIEVTWSYVKN